MVQILLRAYFLLSEVFFMFKNLSFCFAVRNQQWSTHYHLWWDWCHLQSKRICGMFHLKRFFLSVKSLKIWFCYKHNKFGNKITVQPNHSHSREINNTMMSWWSKHIKTKTLFMFIYHQAILGDLGVIWLMQQ